MSKALHKKILLILEDYRSAVALNDWAEADSYLNVLKLLLTPQELEAKAKPPKASGNKKKGEKNEYL